MGASENKKRAAASQGGPASKKVHLDKDLRKSKDFKGKSALKGKDTQNGKSGKGTATTLKKTQKKEVDAPAAKRRKPVTATSEPSDESEDDGDLASDAEDAEDDAAIEEDEGAEDDAMEGVVEADDSAPNPKDPEAVREARKAQKAVTAQRKASKPHASLIAQAKAVWAQARRKNITPKERQQAIRELMDVIRGHVKELANKHDASRIVQTAVKYGSAADRDTIAGELMGSFKDLAQNKYSRFLVTKLVRLCPKRRAAILREFQGHVLRLLLHREASVVLADAFELYANAAERAILLRDFYGKEAALFDIAADADTAKEGLSGVLKGAEDAKRTRILTAVRENLEAIFNNPDKGALTHAIVHRALWEYVAAVIAHPDRALSEKLYREAFDMCQDTLAEMVHTKDGSRVAREFLARGSAKDRKQIIKHLSKHVIPMCTDEDAQLVLFTAVDVVDDTKLLAKSLIVPITADASTLATSTAGRRALLYLLVPRSRRHFTPAQINTLAETDGVRDGTEGQEGTSKKAVDVRQTEVRQAASQGLLDWVKENGEEAIRETGQCVLVGEIVLEAEGDKSAATTTLLRAVSAPYPAAEDAPPHVIDLPHAARLYKTLLQGGHFNHGKGAVEPSPRWDAKEFAVRFMEAIAPSEGASDDTDAPCPAIAMCTRGARGGAFVIAELLGALPEDKRKEVAGWFTKAVRKEIEAGEGKGKGLLLERLGK
ncbi:armadillo-type protein [Schizophyllum commune]